MKKTRMLALAAVWFVMAVGCVSTRDSAVDRISGELPPIDEPVQLEVVLQQKIINPYSSRDINRMIMSWKSAGTNGTFAVIGYGKSPVFRRLFPDGFALLDDPMPINDPVYVSYVQGQVVLSATPPHQ